MAMGRIKVYVEVAYCALEEKFVGLGEIHQNIVSHLNNVFCNSNIQYVPSPPNFIFSDYNTREEKKRFLCFAELFELV